LSILGCLLPATNCTLGTLSSGSLTASSGTVSSDTLTYSQAGAIQVYLSDTTFTAVDASDTALAARTIISTAVTLGRFVPDHYVLTMRQVGVLAAAQNSCTASGSGFTFLGQTFTWATVPQVMVTAYGAANNVLTDWSGSLQHLIPSTATTPVATVLSSGSMPALTATWGAMSLSDLGGGSASLSFSASDRFVFNRDPATPSTGFQGGVDFTLSVVDTSELAGASSNPTVSSTGSVRLSGATQLSFNNGGYFYYGRLKLQNAAGDARFAQKALLELQTYDGTNWVRLQSDQGCLNFPVTAVGFTGGSGFLATNACAAPVTGSFATSYGRAYVPLSKSPATGGNQTGATAIVLNILSTVEGSSCLGSPAVPGTPVSASLPWLATTRSTTNQDSNPMSRITWGTRSREWIGQRELY
jgi:hypothetical protein